MQLKLPSLLSCMVLEALKDFIPKQIAVVACLIAEAVARTADLELLKGGHFVSKWQGIMLKGEFLQFLIVVGLLYLVIVRGIGADSSPLSGNKAEKEKLGKA